MTPTHKRIFDLLTEAPYMTAVDVALTLEVSTDVVYRLARKHRLKYAPMRPRPTEREIARIAALARHGVPDSDIAYRLTMSVHTVANLRREAGIRHTGGPINPIVSAETRRKIATMHLVQGLAYNEICKRLNVTKGCVAGAVYRAKRGKLKGFKVRVEKEVETA